MVEAHRFGAGETAKIDKGQDPVAYLGGKGAHLQIMAGLGVPVPPGFTIPTKHCVEFMGHEGSDQSRQAMVHEAAQVALAGLTWLTDITGFTPLVSVRSGAPVSMPGMMDTILNVGLTDDNLAEWAERIGAWATVDSYRRLMQMLGGTALGIDHHKFDHFMIAARKKDEVSLDKDISLETMAWVVDAFRQVWVKESGRAFPQTVKEQLELAIGAVWASWDNPRAHSYRDLNKIDHKMGTAVTVQAMVFGNMNDDSGSGVMFTRNPNSGVDEVLGEFLPCAQGEDVVAGIRTPLPLSDMAAKWPKVTDELLAVAGMLEAHYRDVQDIEFTVQDGKLFLLQTRSAKRSALAAVKIAHALLLEGKIDPATLLKRITPQQMMTARAPVVDPTSKNAVLGKGLPACPGVGIGCVATSSAQAVKLAAQGYAVILVTKETTPDDIDGMIAAKGILTSTGGATSHAAVVARALDKPCIVGCSDMTVLKDSVSFLNGPTKMAGTQTEISLDGLSGVIFDGKVSVLDASEDESMKFLELKIWAKDGATPRTSGTVMSVGGVAKAYVQAADWMDDPAAGAAKFLNSLGAVSQTSKLEVYLDMAPPSALLPQEDQRLMRVIGTKTLTQEEQLWTSSVVESLSMADDSLVQGVVVLNGSHFTAGEIELLKAKGMVMVRETKTMADVMAGDAVIVTPQFVDKIIGGKKTWGQLKAMLTDKGLMHAYIAPTHSTVEEAAFRVLAK